MVKKSLLWVYRTVFLLVSIALIVAAVAVIALRYIVLPHIDEYKDEFAAKISHSIGQKLTINQMSTGWDGFNLKFSLRDVNVYDAENRPALSLNHIETTLSWLSIPLLEPRLASIIINQPELTIRREKDGVIYVAGISMSGQSHPEFANWVLRQSEINVLDAKVLWQDDMRAAPPLTFTKLNLKIVNPAWKSLIGQHYFGLTATPSAGSSFPIDIRGEVFGKNVADKNSWNGTLYGKLEGTDIAAWRQWIDYPFELREGYGAAQFWLQFANAKAYSITSDVALSHVKTQLSKSSREAVLNQLTGRLQWIQHDDGQEIQAEHIKIQSNDGLNLQNGHVALREHHTQNKQWLEGSIKLDEMNLADLTTFASYFPLAEETLSKINALSPSGMLKNIDVSWNGDGDIPQQYSLHSQFNNIAINAYQDIPGISHLSGNIDADENNGTLNLSAQQTVLNMQSVMREATPIDRLSGQIKWQNSQGKNTEIQVKNLAISNAHIAGMVNARYLNNKVKGGFLELNGKFGQADAKKAYYYYPRILGDDTTHWLKNAIQDGRLENINILVKGNLNDFPFTDNKNGLFRVTAEIDHGTLEYSPGWPKIEAMKLDMLFEGKRMELNSKAGHMLGNQITKAKVTIPDLTVSDPVLSIVGETQGPVSEGIKYINTSPLSKIMLGFTDDLRTTGLGKLNLDLHLPLEHTDDAKVKGSFVVSNGSMASDSIPEMTRLNGKIDFTESALNAQNVNTWIYGGPAAFSVNTNADHTIKILARGHLTDAGLKQAFSDTYTRYISGGADWYSTISILNKQADINIHSDLIGITSSLPAPLKKLANESMPLVITKKQASSEQEIMRLNLGNIVGAKISRIMQNGVSKFDRGEITVNALPELPIQSGLSLRGNLDSLNLDDWRKLLQKSSSNHSTNSDVGLNKVDMSVNTLDIFGRRINSLKLLAKPTNDGWQLNLQSQEITGDAQWHHDGDGKIIARLKNLIVPSASPSSTASLGAASASVANPKSTTQDLASQNLTKDSIIYPELDITADNFEVGQKKLGRMELQAKEENDNWSIQKLKLITPDNTLNASGDWFNWKRNPNTLMSFQWSISDLGKTAARLGSPDTIKGGEGEISGQLKWAGSPHEFDLAKLSGNLQIESKKGQILKIQPGVGRLFSVLSLQNLPRRLTLDFKDVFSSGFTFDKISATVNISRGVMKSDNFKLEGPTARVDMHGETDLQKETQHLYVKVTPYISDSLSLAAFAGGPAVGAAAYIAQKILRDPLNKLAEDEYEIVGTWDNPRDVEAADVNFGNKIP